MPYVAYEGAGESLSGDKMTCTAGRTNAPVNVRERASISGRIVTKLPKGTEVEMTGKCVENGGDVWEEVIYNGKTCWCDRQWING